MTFHPWRCLRELTDVEVVWKDVEEELGCYDYCARRITMDSTQTQAERRSTLAHELMHIERGPFPDEQREREELIVEREAARLLIEIKPLAEAMAWSTDMHEIADELWVDEMMLRSRLHNLHPAERAYLHRRLAEL